jgi:outer membrane receptor protein involved in Fe transport
MLTGASMMTASPLIIAAEVNEVVERIVVTGSRIKHTSAQMTTPTTIIDAETIAQSGAKNIGDLLNTMPALLGSVGGGVINNNNNGNINNAGLELANLRGLGTNRTLVLVDGRRHVPGSAGSSAVDMSMIPVSLVARVEIITGGASAIYGADAVTGVVNFILKNKFEGFEADLSSGLTAQNDGETKDLSLTWGSNFSKGKGNITVHGSYSQEKEISITARDYANLNHTWGTNPLNTGPNDGISDTIFMKDERYQALSAEGLFYVPNSNYQFGQIPITSVSSFGPPVFAADPFNLGYDTYTIDRDDGHFRDFIAGSNCTVVPCNGGDGFRTAETGTLNAPNERFLLNFSSHYELGDDHKIFAEAKYAKTESAASNQASVFHDDNYGPLINIKHDNPFAPQELVKLMKERSLDSVGLAVIGMNARSKTERETTQFTFGGEGSLGDYGYTFYAQYGKVESIIDNEDVLNENYYRALDAVDDGHGNAVCRSVATNPDCVAYNPIYFQASAEARAYAGVTLHTKDKIEQTVFSFTLDGELFETTAGIVDFVVGLEYRDESSQSTPDELTQAIDPDGFGAGLVGSTTGPSKQQNLFLKPTDGGYDVSEIFGEVLVPLVDGVTGIENLDLELAARYTDHSVTGGDSTYKAAMNWAIVDDFRVRTTFSHAVRAPNIQELFAPEQSSAGNMTDPCSANRQALGPADGNRQVNCAALGIAPDFTSSADFGARNELQSGNLALTPESANTLTLGLVYTPTTDFSCLRLLGCKNR